MPRRKSDAKIAEEKRATVFAEIHRKLCTVQSKQDQVNDMLEKLQAFAEKYPDFLKNTKIKQKSITLHSNIVKSFESQVEYLRNLLSEIEKLRKLEYKSKMKGDIKRRDLMELIHRQGVTLPLWVNSEDGFPGEYVGAIAPDDASKLYPGDSVAAFSKDNWILAEVVSCHSTSRYECRDVDDEQKTMAVFSRHRLIPLPKWRADPHYDKHALFPVNAFVLALYPQTTCFYKGVVHVQPSTATEPYQVEFEDPSYPTGFSPPMSICQKYVVSFKEVKTGKRDRDIDEMEE